MAVLPAAPRPRWWRRAGPESERHRQDQDQGPRPAGVLAFPGVLAFLRGGGCAEQEPARAHLQRRCRERAALHHPQGLAHEARRGGSCEVREERQRGRRRVRGNGGGGCRTPGCRGGVPAYGGAQAGAIAADGEGTYGIGDETHPDDAGRPAALPRGLPR
uniref:Uncharacterized protein n=1 Tax=Zea mays TaxID=4577 RepID=B4G1T8_MAIZE|nr:unknown [Zea mays]